VPRVAIQDETPLKPSDFFRHPATPALPNASPSASPSSPPAPLSPEGAPPKYIQHAAARHLSTTKRSLLLLKVLNEMTKYYPDVAKPYTAAIASFLASMKHHRSLRL
jgi:hypothetical protein